MVVVVLEVEVVMVVLDFVVVGERAALSPTNLQTPEHQGRSVKGR